MRKLNKPKSISLSPAILTPLQACNKKPDSGEQAKKAYDALSQNRPPFAILKKALKKSGFGKVIRDFATGAALYLDGRKSEALPFLLESNNATNNWYFKYTTGLCLIDFNRFEESKPLIDAGLAITEASSDLWHLLGVYHQNKQEEEAACEAYKRSIDIEPDRAHTLSNLATGLEKLGHLEKALAHSARALELRPSVLPLLHNHAHILTRLGKFGEATKLYEHVAQQPNASAVSISSFFYNQLYK